MTSKSLFTKLSYPTSILLLGRAVLQLVQVLDLVGERREEVMRRQPIHDKEPVNDVDADPDGRSESLAVLVVHHDGADLRGPAQDPPPDALYRFTRDQQKERDPGKEERGMKPGRHSRANARN